MWDTQSEATKGRIFRGELRAQYVFIVELRVKIIHKVDTEQKATPQASPLTS